MSTYEASFKAITRVLLIQSSPFVASYEQQEFVAFSQPQIGRFCPLPDRGWVDFALYPTGDG